MDVAHGTVYCPVYIEKDRVEALLEAADATVLQKTNQRERKETRESVCNNRLDLYNTCWQHIWVAE